MQQPDPKKPDYNQILIELIKLRETDYDAFMNRLYDAINGEFRYTINDSAPRAEKEQAIWTMIEHFSSKEEYEKCADLKRIVEAIKS